MADGFSIKAVRGDMARVEKALHNAATKEMRTNLRKIMAEETKPTRTKIKKSALDTLPARGGAAKRFAKLPTQNTDFREKSAGVKIVLKRKGSDLQSLDKGRLRHPLFGNRKHWYEQSVAAGFFTKPIEEDADDLKRRISGRIDKYVNELERKAN